MCGHRQKEARLEWGCTRHMEMSSSSRREYRGRALSRHMTACAHHATRAVRIIIGAAAVTAFLAGCAATATRRGRSARTLEAHRFSDTAQLTGTSKDGVIWTDVGVATGSLPMTMTVVQNDQTASASFIGHAHAGSILGTISVDQNSLTETSTSQGAIYRVSGEATITHGTGAFRDGSAKLTMQGEVNTGVHSLKLILNGVYYY